MGRLSRSGASLSALASLVVLVMAAVLVTGAVLVSHAADTLDTLRQMSATADGISDLGRDVQLALLQAEIGQSGYLLTGRPDYLAPYWASSSAMRGSLARLDQLGDRDQEAWLRPEVNTLRALGERKLDEMERSIAAADTTGIAAARATMLTNDSHATMQAAQAVIEGIQARAAADRDRRAAEVQHSERVLFFSVLLTAVAGVLLLGTASLALLFGRDRLLRAQAAVRQQSARWQGTVENLYDGVAVFDSTGRLVLCNARLLAVTGLPAGLAQPGTPYAHFVAEAEHWDPPVLANDPAAREDAVAETRTDGRVLEVSRGTMPDGGHMLTIGDVTQRVQAETIARQSQKMDVLGQLTGGVAHDFNNLLQVISANLESVESAVRDDPVLRDRIAGAMEGVQRGAQLTRHLLAFARRQPLAPAPLDATRLLAGLEEMLRRTLGSAVSLEMVVADGLWSLRADAQQLENALLNLAINARDAMAGQAQPARLTIEAYNAGVDDSYAAQNADVTPGQYVVIAVTDNGRGMAPEQIARAVEPFYTTKPEGKGTGLGLPMVYGFAKQSGGQLKLYSEVGRGTTARLYIPRTIATPEPVAPPTADAPKARGEMVLLVEDEPTVRASAALALHGLGYAVQEAADADTAVLLLEQGLRPNLLLTDMVMPGVLNARGLAERAQALVPGLAVVFTSGYSEAAILRSGQLDQHVVLVSKPWRTAELARQLRVALRQASALPAKLRILLAEDEQMIRTVTADILSTLGHTVTEVESVDEGLPYLMETDLLIADIGLRDSDGLQLAAEARAARPGLPVIIASGDDPPARNDNAYTWLAKPYNERALHVALAQATGATPD